MYHVLLSQSGSFREHVDYLSAQGARVTLLGPDKVETGFESKLAIVMQMFSPTLLRLRGLWKSTDRVLVVGWQAIPVLTLIKLGLLPRPAKTLVMGLFIHGRRARQIVNRVLRAVRFEGLGFITFSNRESEQIVQDVGIDQRNVHLHLWRVNLDGKVAPDEVTEGDYVFSGGYSNRDYDLLLAAMRGIPTPLVVIASAKNRITESRDKNTRILRDIEEGEFERMLAKSRLVVLPLKSESDACGQSVLLRVLRNGKPVVSSRHSAVEHFLGVDYPGFVPAEDVNAMHDAIERALGDAEHRRRLEQAVVRAQQRIDASASVGQEVLQFLTA